MQAKTRIPRYRALLTAALAIPSSNLDYLCNNAPKHVTSYSSEIYHRGLLLCLPIPAHIHLRGRYMYCFRSLDVLVKAKTDIEHLIKEDRGISCMDGNLRGDGLLIIRSFIFAEKLGGKRNNSNNSRLRSFQYFVSQPPLSRRHIHRVQSLSNLFSSPLSPFTVTMLPQPHTSPERQVSCLQPRPSRRPIFFAAQHGVRRSKKEKTIRLNDRFGQRVHSVSPPYLSGSVFYILHFKNLNYQLLLIKLSAKKYESGFALDFPFSEQLKPNQGTKASSTKLIIRNMNLIPHILGEERAKKSEKAVRFHVILESFGKAALQVTPSYETQDKV
ncbi:hypothetical protein ABKN59_005385 [Abortiporus biennis]